MHLLELALLELAILFFVSALFCDLSFLKGHQRSVFFAHVFIFLGTVSVWGAYLGSKVVNPQFLDLLFYTCLLGSADSFFRFLSWIQGTFFPKQFYWLSSLVLVGISSWSLDVYAIQSRV